MKHTRIRILLCMLTAILLPQLAFANAGTPLIWVHTLYLLFGNAVLGLIEGSILAAFFRLKFPSTILWLIIANYVSAWLGGQLGMYGIIDWIDPTIENVGAWIWGFMLIAFVLTLVLEAPFYYLATRKKKVPLKRFALALLLMNSITYTGLALIYANVSVRSMVTQLDVVPFDSLNVPGSYQFYYISPDGEFLMHHSMDPLEPVQDQSLPSVDYRFELRAVDTENSRIDLVYSPYHDSDSNDELRLVTDFASAAIVKPYTVYHMPVPKLTDSTEWDYRTTDWAGFGIYGYKQTNQDKVMFRYAMETPFSSWRIRYPTHIEGDFVIFQLGRDQICILQPIERKIALIARGSNPVVYRPKSTGSGALGASEAN